MKKEDRNTAIIIIVVLVVCTVSLVAIGSSLWNIISPGVNAALNFIGINIRLATVDYNFSIATNSQVTTTSSESTSSSSSASTTSESTSSSAPSVVPASYSYNFPVPTAAAVGTGSSAVAGLRDAILTDAQLAGYGSTNETPQTELIVEIPKIQVVSPVFQGLGGDDLLDRGFWVYPTSKALGKGEIILLCHRRYFGPYDPRSCWNLDKVSAGDEIFVRGSLNTTLKYKVIATNVFEANDPLIYTTSDTDNYLKIVTCTPLYSNANRLVVLAELQD